jgi:threonine synthase
MSEIYYRSTRGGGEVVTASEAILKGIADDGGLFVPEVLPQLDEELKELVYKDYKDLAYSVMSKFFTDFNEIELRECIEKAYDGKFDTTLIAPVRKVGESYFLELFHGPTLAFKDMALAILPHLLKVSMKKQKLNKKVVILTATSGDTGKAALEGFTDIDGIKIIVFYPQDGVSEIQKRQMITHQGGNTFVVAIKGNFDDAQNGVKEIFNDSEFIRLLDENNYVLSSANSINIGRLVPQIVYYFYAYCLLCRQNEIKVGESINVSVPTGNFGNILAAYYAKTMGLPINRLICASNENKVLCDFINSGTYNRNREFLCTISPSMDILISSNLERLLYEISDKESAVVKNLMIELAKTGEYKINDSMRGKLEDFYGAYTTELETIDSISEVFTSEKYLMDTHTAVAYRALYKYKECAGDQAKAIIVSTASPYKFTNAVMNALDRRYSSLDDFQLINEMEKCICEDIPRAIKGIDKRPVLHNFCCEKNEMKNTVENILL